MQEPDTILTDLIPSFLKTKIQNEEVKDPLNKISFFGDFTSSCVKFHLMEDIYKEN